jgi:hypothetical protein
LEYLGKRHRGRIDWFAYRELLALAYHEAGHAILAWATGRKLLLVSILLDPPYGSGADPKHGVEAGCVMLSPLPSNLDLREPKHRALAEREAMISLSGELAEARFRGHRRRTHLNQADLDGLTYVGAHAGREGLDPYLDRLAARTALFLDIYWRHVEVLVDALLRRLRLTGQQVGEILRGVDTLGAMVVWQAASPVDSPERLGLARGVRRGQTSKRW